MNKIETMVYGIVRKNPAIKQFVRNAYQSAFDLLPRQANYFAGDADSMEGAFFGFHDVSPFSDDDTKMLANRNSFDLRMPVADESLEVGYFDLADGRFGDWHKIGVSYAWNYHKGCRLQWLDDSRVIFNTGVEGSAVSQIVNIETKRIATLPYPIDAVRISDDEEVATTFSYERLERCMPGYGYPYSDNGLVSESHPAETGLFLVDLRTGKRELLVSLDELAKSLPEDLHEGVLHFVTHTEFSHDGRYISFLYRRIPIDGDYMKRWTQMRVYDRMTRRIVVLPSQNSGSHYVWNGRNQLIASCFMDGTNCHVLFDMNDVEHPKIIAPEVLNSDGHQSFVTDDLFVTDTYPDRWRMASIYKVDATSGRAERIVKIYSPKMFQTRDFKCHIACDLHPRVSKSGKYLCFDSPTTGQRSLYIMKL